MIMQMTDIQLFQIQRQKLGEKEAEALVQFVDGKLKENNDQNLKVAATKEDIAILRGDMKADKAKIIKWMFVFIMGLLISLSGIMIAILHAYLR